MLVASAVASPGEDRVRRLEVARASLVFLRDVVDITRGDHEMLDALIFTAALDANMALVDRDASLHGAYGGATASAPDALRRPVSINAVAQSLGLPFETVRRRALKMAREGRCEIGPKGIVVPHRSTSAAAYEAEQWARFERMRLFHQALRSLGVTPAGASRPPPDAPLVRAVNWAVSGYALRTCGGLIALTGNVLTSLVLLELTLANMASLPASSLEKWALDPARIGRPVRIAALSEAMRLPGETVRRHLQALEASGFCARGTSGFTAQAPGEAVPTLLGLAETNRADLRRLLDRLDQLGVLAAWTAEPATAP
ncbi:MAG: hypothetical protein J7521_15415 [Caulobacter sp.]|nr:hypothetical protein [Caulobacter sp.]